MPVKEQLRTYLTKLLYDIAATDQQVVLLIILLVITVIVLDAISIFARKQRKKVGIEPTIPGNTSARATNALPPRLYVSNMQGLSGKPDAVISESGFLIPVERKPLAKKIRDRHVAQLLVYMRLIEEFEGKRPPYGYLILGPNCRRVKVLNSPEKQAWLQKMIDEMRAIYAGHATAVPTPHPHKCKKCGVRAACGFNIGKA